MTLTCRKREVALDVDKDLLIQQYGLTTLLEELGKVFGTNTTDEAYTDFEEYGTVSRNPVCRIRQIVFPLHSLRENNRQTVPRIRQIGFRQTGHIPFRNLQTD